MPRVIPVIGLVGGPLIFVSGIAEMFGLYGPFSVWVSIGGIPVFAWEMSLAVWMIVRGFQPSPIITGREVSGLVHSSDSSDRVEPAGPRADAR